MDLAAEWGRAVDRPWLMVSINDGEDPHFRKAFFDASACPPSCSQPCIGICPTDAIAFSQNGLSPDDGVISERCYGCGRCLPVCPFEQIQTRFHRSNPSTIVAELFPQIDALEIHTQIGRLDNFQRLWQVIERGCQDLQVVSISCPDGEGVIAYLWQLYQIMQLPQDAVIWQTDGRPMSGDIGAGTTQATIRYAKKMLAKGPPGFVQLAGGTNHSTVPRLKKMGLLGDEIHPHKRQVSGVAYGSYARKGLTTLINKMEETPKERSGAFDKFSQLLACSSIEYCCTKASLIHQAVNLADSLTSQLKPQRELPPTTGEG